jgi:hypothetical protein
MTHTNKISIHHFLVNKWCGNLKLVYQGMWNTNTEVLQSYQHLEEIRIVHNRSLRESPHQSILPYKQDRKSTSHIENPRLLPERVLTNQSCHTNKTENLLHTLRIHDCYLEEKVSSFHLDCMHQSHCETYSSAVPYTVNLTGKRKHCYMVNTWFTFNDSRYQYKPKSAL